MTPTERGERLRLLRLDVIRLQDEIADNQFVIDAKLVAIAALEAEVANAAVSRETKGPST